MPTHADAIGYLNDLATEINEPWFKMICDAVAISGVSILDESTLDSLLALYTKNASYVGGAPNVPVVTPAAAATPPADFLNQLSGFTNFKLLGDTLEVRFQKRVTLIFGANGSGKSSLCESLKVLATPEQPGRPLQNVRANGTATPSFCYQFRSDAVHQAWTPASGFGPKQSTVKYFDTAIAIKNVKSAVEPGRVIILTPFKLHVFGKLTALLTAFRDALQNIQRDNSSRLTNALEAIRTDFSKFKGSPLSAIDDKTATVLPTEIKIGEVFSDHTALTEKLAAAAELEKAASEEGLKLLRAELREMESLLTDLNTLFTSASEMWALEPAKKATIIEAKQREQEVLAKALLPEGGTLDVFLTMLRSAAPLCHMDGAAGETCPLCKRDLGTPEVDLFKQYHELLAGDLEAEIAVLKEDVAKAIELANSVAGLDRNDWDKNTTISVEQVATAKAESDIIVASCDATKEPAAESSAALDKLKAMAAGWALEQEAKKSAIAAAAKGKDELIDALAKIRGEIEPLEYSFAISERLPKLREAQGMVEESKFWNDSLPGFTQVQRSITQKAKTAHEELIVTDFETRLNAEYRALAEKDMAAFGVRLARRGADAAVTVLPQIGGKEIEGVLSEGEQRIHALALFFAELETCPQSVLVFDDPISSFDYNYVANYCARLRDLTLHHTGKQIIVLTHNWEFFVQLQTTLNQAGLDAHLSVQVLENCAAVADYSEKIDDLKKDIEDVLAVGGEPSKGKKEEIAGKMRRLIEALMNTHVFNHQRHQFKQKSLAISAFQSFTKIVALLPAEATTLRDLYGKLSITEHDDPRNAYVNTDKAMFQTRYDSIVAIESAIVSRK